MEERQKLTILVVGGHPADVFDHCGGTLCHHVQAGDRVVGLAMTQGLRIHDIVLSEKFRNGIPDDAREEFERIKKEREEAKYQETRDACACLGINEVRFLSYDDDVLIENNAMIKSVAKVIRDVRPNIIITHYPFEEGGVGSHHANTARIVMHAIQLAATVDFETSVPGWRIAQTFFMIASSLTQSHGLLGAMNAPFVPFYVDITDVIERKVAALNCMKSQQYGGRYALKRTEVNEGAYGHHNRTAYCEAFVPANPDLYHLLPVSKQRLAWENEQELETRKRGSLMKVPFLYDIDRE